MRSQDEIHQLVLTAVLDTLPQFFSSERGVICRKFKLGNYKVVRGAFCEISEELSVYFDECIQTCVRITDGIPDKAPNIMHYRFLQQICATIWLEKQTGIDTWGKIFDYFYRIRDRTIENFPVSKSFIVSNEPKPEQHRTIDFFDPDSYRIMDWLTTSVYTFFKVTSELEFLSYESILPSKIRNFSSNYIPDFLWPMASQVSIHEAQSKLVLVEGNSRGDIIISGKKNIIASRVKGQWSVYDYPTLANSIANCLKYGLNLDVGIELKYLSRVLFRLLFDISFRRHGGLIVIDRSLSHFKKYSTQGVFRNDDSTYSKLIPEQSIAEANPDVTAIKKILEISSIDGATFISLDGLVQGFGAIIAPHSDIKELSGSRTIAAKSAARYGSVSFKISSDGEVIAHFQIQSHTGNELHSIRF